MDRTRAKQGKEAWLQPSGEIQDKTGKYWRTRALLIHQLVLVYWRVVPQTISFYNPEPSYTRSSLMAYAERCRDEVALPRHGCIAETSWRGCTVKMPRHGCATETPRHGNIAKTNLSYFCVVGSRPWHIHMPMVSLCITNMILIPLHDHFFLPHKCHKPLRTTFGLN